MMKHSYHFRFKLCLEAWLEKCMTHVPLGVNVNVYVCVSVSSCGKSEMIGHSTQRKIQKKNSICS
jgi:hypothetical protein